MGRTKRTQGAAMRCGVAQGAAMRCGLAQGAVVRCGLTVGAATVLLSVGMSAAGPAGAGASAVRAVGAPSTRSARPTVQGLREVPRALAGRSVGATAGLRARSAASLGAVTFVNNLTNRTPFYDFALALNGQALGAFSLPVGTYSSPQILPAGTYSLEVSDSSAHVVATATVVVAAGVDSSVALYGSGVATNPTPTVTQYADPVTAVPAGDLGISFRDESASAGSVELYLDGRDVGALAERGAINVAATPGVHEVTVYAAGTHTHPLLDELLAGGPDSLEPTYLADRTGGASGLLLLNTTSTEGYQFAASDGGVFTFGGHPFLGSTGSVKLNAPIVGAAESPLSGGPLVQGYYLVGADGGVFDFGNAAPFRGSTGGIKLNAPIVGIAATSGTTGPGYVMVGADGGVFTFDSPFYGSLGSTKLTSPVVGIAAFSTGGYVIAQADGSFTQFGPGITTPQTMPALPLNKPIVGIATTPDGAGLWMVASDGGVFDFGDAGFFGSTGAIALNQPVVGIVPSYDGLGYALVARDGGVFTFGTERFFGSTGSIHLNAPVVTGLG